MSELTSIISLSADRRRIMPFITAGDPDLNFTKSLLLELDKLEPGLFEIGFPYSDPIADGPVIQASYTRALENGLKVDQIFQAMSDIKQQMTQPRVAMVSFAIVLRYGTEKFLQQAANSGFSGLIVPDYLWTEDRSFQQQCREHGLHLIPLITPLTERERAKWIAEQATGFIYYVSVAGVTGERTELPPELVQNLAWLKQQTDTPICVGFGVSGPKQVEQLREHCDGLIVGSAVMKRVAKASAGESKEAVIAEVSQFVRQLIDAA